MAAWPGRNGIAELALEAEAPFGSFDAEKPAMEQRAHGCGHVSGRWADGGRGQRGGGGACKLRSESETCSEKAAQQNTA